LAGRLVDELANRFEAKVTLLVTDAQAEPVSQAARVPGVRILEYRRLSPEVFRQAGIADATAVALVTADDLTNIDAARQAEKVSPEVRLVVRVVNPTLRTHIEAMFIDAVVLSEVDIAAPVFVAAALGVGLAQDIKLGHLRATVKDRGDLGDGDVILAGLAQVHGVDRTRLFPAHIADADLLLVATDHQLVTLPALRRQRWRRWSRPAAVWRALSSRGLPNGRIRARARDGLTALTRRLRAGGISRGVLVALAVLGAVMLSCSLAFTILNRRDGVWHSMFLLVLATLNQGDWDSGQARLLRLLQLVMTCAGTATLPVLGAAVVQAAVPSWSRLSAIERGHVVVVGVGDLGTRVVQILSELGHRVVVVDRVADPSGAQEIRDRRIHMIISGGPNDSASALRRANAGHARAVLALTPNDMRNLEYGLQGRDLRAEVRVVLRLVDSDFAGQAMRVFNVDSSRSVPLLAAPAFAAAMLAAQVVAISIRRQMVLLAEIPVRPGRGLVGRPLSSILGPGEGQVIALWEVAERYPSMSFDRARLLKAGERIAVVATRTSLGKIMTEGS
jgi:Trk K+ transport system NAD-binding subunit